MSILIHDTARNTMASWTSRAVIAGHARGGVLSPFSSPVSGTGYKPDASVTVQKIRDNGGEIWFDAATHALDMPDVGDFRYYDEWDLWSAGRGSLGTEPQIRDHVRRVFAIQTEMSAPLLAPTRLLHSAQSSTSQHAYEIARIAMEEGSGRDVWVSVVGDTHFWSAGNELDAHMGLLDQLEPAGWLFTVARPQNSWPSVVSPTEVAGLMRTVFALSKEYEVIIGHGDLQALPAVAAGATTVGTGWDVRQRICAYPDYASRDGGSDGGQWFQRRTLEILLGALMPNEYSVLLDQDLSRAERLTQGIIATGPGNVFSHHARTLTSIIEELNLLTGKARVDRYRDRLQAARAEWVEVQRITGCTSAASQWIDPLLAGVDQFVVDEGW